MPHIGPEFGRKKEREREREERNGMSYIVYIGIGGYLAKNTVGIEQRNTVKLVPKENL